MISQRNQDIIIIESDEEDDILALDSPTICSTNQTSFYNLTCYGHSPNTVKPRLSSTSNGLKHKELLGTATAAIINEKPLNIFDLSFMNKTDRLENNVFYIYFVPKRFILNLHTLTVVYLILFVKSIFFDELF